MKTLQIDLKMFEKSNGKTFESLEFTDNNNNVFHLCDFFTKMGSDVT